MTELSAREVALIRQLRQDGVLRDVDPKKFETQRLVMVTCADGDRLPEILSYHGRLVGLGSASSGNPCHQTFALNGGGLLLAHESPLVHPRHHVETLLRKQIQAAIDMKGLALNGRPTVILYTHAPCGAAGAAKMSILQQLTTLAQAKNGHKAIEATEMTPEEMREKGWRMPLFFHVHFPATASKSACDRSYCVSSRIFYEWLKQQEATRQRRDDALTEPIRHAA